MQAVIPNPLTVFERKVDLAFHIYIASLDPLRLYIGEGNCLDILDADLNLFHISLICLQLLVLDCAQFP